VEKWFLQESNTVFDDVSSIPRFSHNDVQHIIGSLLVKVGELSHQRVVEGTLLKMTKIVIIEYCTKPSDEKARSIPDSQHRCDSKDNCSE